MTSRLSIMALIVALIGASPAAAACRSFGTQLECDLAETRIIFGTQAEPAPRYSSSIPAHGFDGDGALMHDRQASHLPFEINIQNIGADPSLCRKIWNETYCY